jgi:hypothetical protein
MEDLSGGQVTRDNFIRIPKKKPDHRAGFKCIEKVTADYWLAA